MRDQSYYTAALFCFNTFSNVRIYGDDNPTVYDNNMYINQSTHVIALHCNVLRSTNVFFISMFQHNIITQRFHISHAKAVVFYVYFFCISMLIPF